MRKLLLFLSLALLACTFPLRLAAPQTPAPTPSASPSPTPPATAEPGTEKNPLILALAPSPRAEEARLPAGEQIAAFLEARTGYRLVTVVPASESALVQAFERGNAQIAVLSPFAYVMARRAGSVTAVLGSSREGQMWYGAQFIANRENGLVSYYDEARGSNTAEAAAALGQLEDKKPCWSDGASPSGYVVPLGLLNRSGIRVRSGAFLAGQPSVVRAVYADDICDFGATFVDARRSPALEADYPDVIERVIVIWRVPPLIPYEIVVLSARLPIEMRRVLQRAFIDLMLTPDGRTAVQAAYGVDELQVAEDVQYADFEAYVLDSGLDLEELVGQPFP